MLNRLRQEGGGMLIARPPPQSRHPHMPFACLCPSPSAVQGGQALLTAEVRLTDPFGSYDKLPTRRSDYDFKAVSRVLSEPIK